MIHLDTNYLIAALVRNSVESQRLIGWLRGAEDVRMSAVAWCEFLCGPVQHSDVDMASTIVGQPVAFHGAAATAAAQLFNSAKRRKGSLNDCMIAASALADGASLATNNREDFERFAAEGLVLIRS
jgi:predicted nucleic acid-binding protein